MALNEDTSVFIADSHATSAAVTVVVGVERAGESGGGGARVGVGELERLHHRGGGGSKSFYDSKGENSFMLFSGSAAAAAAAAATYNIYQ